MATRRSGHALLIALALTLPLSCGGGGSGGLLFKALCRMYSNKSPEQITAFLAGKTDADKTALRKNPKIAAIIEEIRAETGKSANIDTDELLAELGE